MVGRNEQDNNDSDEDKELLETGETVDRDSHGHKIRIDGGGKERLKENRSRPPQSRHQIDSSCSRFFRGK